MAQTPKGRLVQGLYKPIHGTCAMYFYLGVKEMSSAPIPTNFEGIFGIRFQGGVVVVQHVF